MAADDPKRLPFIPEIEGMRGLLAVIVLVGHISPDYMLWYWISMDVFFCISGFLIVAQILIYGEGRGFLKLFLIRRALRIWPAYYFVLLATAFAGYLWGTVIDRDVDQLLPQQVILSMLFLQNTSRYIGEPIRDVPFYFDHSWSVAVEEQFYVISALLLLAALRRKLSARVLLFALVLLVPISLLYRYTSHWWLLVARMDAFALGAVVALIWARGRELNVLGEWLKAVIPSGALVMGGMLIAPHIMAVYDVLDESDWPRALLYEVVPVTAAGLLSVSFVAAVVFDRRARRYLSFLKIRLLQALGRMSYSIYLTHAIVVFFVVPQAARYFHLPTWAVWVLSIGLTLTIASFCYRYVELAGQRYKPAFQFQGERSERREMPSVALSAAGGQIATATARANNVPEVA